MVLSPPVAPAVALPPTASAERLVEQLRAQFPMLAETLAAHLHAERIRAAELQAAPATTTTPDVAAATTAAFEYYAASTPSARGATGPVTTAATATQSPTTTEQFALPTEVIPDFATIAASATSADLSELDRALVEERRLLVAQGGLPDEGPTATSPRSQHHAECPPGETDGSAAAAGADELPAPPADGPVPEQQLLGGGTCREGADAEGAASGASGENQARSLVNSCGSNKIAEEMQWLHNQMREASVGEHAARSAGLSAHTSTHHTQSTPTLTHSHLAV